MLGDCETSEGRKYTKCWGIYLISLNRGNVKPFFFLKLIRISLLTIMTRRVLSSFPRVVASISSNEKNKSNKIKR